MLDYTRTNCPVCHKPFRRDDDIVVCPQCGAPHHRDCYRALGACAYAEKHGTDGQWKPPLQRDSDGAIVCGNCGTINEKGSKACRKCGHVLEEVFPPAPGEQQPPVDASVFYAQFSPYVGIAPDSLLDGIPAIDVATYLGPRSGFYLSRFYFMQVQKNRFSWNWAAALFPALWAVYRKMYRLAILLALITAVLLLPSAGLMLFAVQAAREDPAILRELAAGGIPSGLWPGWLMLAFQLSITASFILRVTMASVGNHLYRRHMVKQIAEIQNAGLDPLHYRYALSKRGGGSPLGAVILLVGASLVILTVFLLAVFG